MTAPAIKVEIGFDANASLGSNFILDDPVQGVLDNTGFTLAGTVFVDVSQWLSGQIATNRGRSRETDQYQAGTLSFTLRNEDRRFDPSNTASPYAPGIKPRARVNAYIAGVQIFGGYVDDLTVIYQQPNICTVTVSCLDGFTVLANSYLMTFTASQQLTGARVSAILDEVAFPATRSIATGNSTLQANIFTSTTVSPIAALDNLQTVARSENGYLFIDKTGVLTFFDRYHLRGATSVATFADTGSGITYQGISQKSQSLLLYNEVIGTRNTNATIGGDSPVAQVAADSGSEKQYLVRALSLSQLENNADSDVLDVCSYLVGKYSQPEVRFDTVVLELQALNVANLAAVLSLDLVSLITVERTPPGSGSPTTISILSTIEGIAFALDVSASTYKMTMQLGSADTRNFFILDDPIFGILDTSKLGY